jgi:predicted nucleic acid-binding protein
MPFAEINKAVWDKAAGLYVYSRQVGKPVGDDTDIIIAALCLLNDYTLVTNNTRHFEHIDGLKLVNWKE